MREPILAAAMTMSLAGATHAGEALAGDALAAPFDSIDGGTLALSDWAGRPVLVANTASMCGFTDQYAGLQRLYDTYRDDGLVVLAVPSDDFQQELDSADEVKEFCEVNYNLTLPMTDITHVKGRAAHPFFAGLREETGWQPRWNFNKVLIGPDGTVLGTWGSAADPFGSEIRGAVEAALGG